MNTAQINSMVDDMGSDLSALTGLLQEIQRKEGYLSRRALTALSARLRLPLSRLYGLATFYRSFSLVPTGRHKVAVCVGTACHVRGSGQVLDRVKRCLGVHPGQTTSDRMFTLNTVNCLGSCALGPVMTVDDRYFGHMRKSKVDEVLDRYRDDPARSEQ